MCSLLSRSEEMDDVVILQQILNILIMWNKSVKNMSDQILTFVTSLAYNQLLDNITASQMLISHSLWVWNWHML